MPHTGPIIIVDDDEDDAEILKFTFSDLQVKNEVLWFPDPTLVIESLKLLPEKPFIIFCDINMPKQNGIHLKQAIDEDPLLRQKSIPFVFYSTSADTYIVNKAYQQLTVQGFFMKGNDAGSVANTIRAIIDYWTLAIFPQ